MIELVLANVARHSCASPGGYIRTVCLPTVAMTGNRAGREKSPIVHYRAVVARFLSLPEAMRSALHPRTDLALENLALRQQLANLRRTSSPPTQQRPRVLVGPLPLLVSPGGRAACRQARHRGPLAPAGFRLFWRWKSRSGSPSDGGFSQRTKRLIRQMAEANVGWGAPRIHNDLLKLGIDIGERSVSRFMPPKPRKPPSQSWRTFLDNYVGSLASIDFFAVPNATFRVLHVFFVLAHDRRRVLHFNVTEHPSAAWTAQQIVEAFPEDTAPRFMFRDRDRDRIVGDQFRRRVQGLGIEEILTAPRSP